MAASLYFIGVALGGGLLALFLSAGWGSFKHKKVPEKAILFRWFIAGLVGSGLLAYAWIFGSGGDMGELINKIGTTSIDLNEVVKAAAAGSAVLTSALKMGGGGGAGAGDSSDAEATGADAAAAASDEVVGKDRAASGAAGDLQVGMPNF
jgi:hypothetical protein